MLLFLVASVVLIGLCDRAARQSRIEAVLLDSRFKLFEIRDDLRFLAIEGKVEHDHWFDYFDTTLTKIIDLLPTLTFWQITLMFFHYKNDRDLLSRSSELTGFLTQEENVEFLRLFERYLRVLSSFMFKRHRMIAILLYGAAKVADGIGGVKSEVGQIVATAPETSTYGRYCRS